MHPYTKTLLSAIPIPDPEIEANKKRIQLEDTASGPIGKEGTSGGGLFDLDNSELVEVSKGHFVSMPKKG
ncbi:Oligopeptide transport ATP-binding protein OppF [compost metagenome]